MFVFYLHYIIILMIFTQFHGSNKLQVICSSLRVLLTLSLSQQQKPLEAAARHWTQKAKCIVGIRIQNVCSLLLGVFLSSSASEATWEPQKKNTSCRSQPPAPIFPSALPRRVTIIFGIGKATSSQGVRCTKTFLINAHSTPVEEVGGEQFQILSFYTYQRVFALNSWHKWVNHSG